MLTPDVEPMLKDQLFLGRGWPYYTAVIDIDLAPPTTEPTMRPTARSSSGRRRSEPHAAGGVRQQLSETAATAIAFFVPWIGVVSRAGRDLASA